MGLSLVWFFNLCLVLTSLVFVFPPWTKVLLMLDLQSVLIPILLHTHLKSFLLIFIDQNSSLHLMCLFSLPVLQTIPHQLSLLSESLLFKVSRHPLYIPSMCLTILHTWLFHSPHTPRVLDLRLNDKPKL